jgi:nucleotide-binding universal stress UspA family protein
MNGSEIVVGVDGSISAVNALKWAADEAARCKAQLMIVYASAVVDSAAYSSATLQMMRSDAAVHGDRVLVEAVGTVRTTHPDLPVTTLLRHQRPAEVLIELSGQCALVVVGSHGANRVIGTLLGSVSQRVAAHAIGTVVVVSGRAPIRDSELGILVGISDTTGGRAALDFACAEAARRGCRVTAVRAYGTFGEYRPGQLYGALPGLREAEAADLSNAVARAQAEYPNVTIDSRLLQQAPTEALARLAADAELLVLGCRHRAGYPSRLGPLTGYLLHHSTCPVAVVGHRQPVEVASNAPAISESLTLGATG